MFNTILINCYCNTSDIGLKIGGYARINGLIKSPELNDELVEIVGFIAKQNRWAVKLIQNKTHHEQKEFAVRSDNLYPTSNSNGM